MSERYACYYCTYCHKTEPYEEGGSLYYSSRKDYIIYTSEGSQCKYCHMYEEPTFIIADVLPEAYYEEQTSNNHGE